MKDTLRVGVIGLGVGEQHIVGFESHPDVTVTTLCDFDPVKLDDVAAKFPGRRLTSDAADVLEDPDIDVVSIASYDSYHFEHVRAALEGHKHVFVEKPLCQRPEEAAVLHRLRDERPHVKVSSNLPLRLSPRFQELRELISGGKLGRLYYLEADYNYGRMWKLTDGWRGELDYYSVMLGGGVHMVDLLLWLTGDRVVRVSAVGNDIASVGTQFKYDDFVTATLELESGAIARVNANFACIHPHFHAVEVYGTEGTFINGLEHATLWTGDRSDPQPTRIESAYPGVEKGDLIPSFVEAILHGTQPIVTADEVFETMDVLFAIERSKTLCEPVELKAVG
jgi:predicted dehydrogenase